MKAVNIIYISMAKKVPLIAVIIILIFAILITFQVTYLSLYSRYCKDQVGSEFSNEIFEKLKYIDQIYKKEYIGDIDKESLENGIMMGYIYGTGDKYGEYMSEEVYNEFISDMQGESQGIGVSVVYNTEYTLIEIVNVLPDSPALEAGIKVGDLIARVEGEDAAELGYSAALSKMQGEAGTTANFTVLRNGEYIDFSIKRGYIKQLTVMYHMHSDGKTGIIKLIEFDDTTFTQFTAAIDDLKSKGAKQFVFDVRDNPGGELKSITDILDYLLPEGPIIRILSRSGEEDVISSDKKEFSAPMAVIANGNTASAAELFTAALKDYKKAVIVGETTYGKGTMQTIIPMSDGSALRISYKMYNPPYSDNYEGVGITPDYEIAMADEYKDISLYKITDQQDTQLIKALELLNSDNIN